MARWQPDARGRLEKAAMELYGERGFEQTTVAQIADRAGLTERTFFRHFADKREVLFAGSGQLEDLLVQAVSDAPASATPIDAVAAGIEAIGMLLEGVLAGALRERGVSEPAASLVAEIGIAVFRVSFERWVSEPRGRELSDLTRESLAEVRSLTAVSAS